MAITAGYLFIDGEAILAKKLNLAFSGAGAFNGTVGATTPNTGAFTTISATDNITLAAAGKTITLSDNAAFPTWQGAALNRTAFLLQREGGTALSAILGAGQGTGYFGYSMGGSFSSPSATTSGRNLVILSANSWGGSTWVQTGVFGFVTDELHSESTRATRFQLNTTPTGAVASVVSLVMTAQGNLIVGPTNNNTGLTGINGLRVESTTDATTSAAASGVFLGGVAVAKKIITGDAITTSAPTTGTAGAWKFGIRVAAATVHDTTQYIQLDVGGTLYKLAIAV